MSGTLQLLGSEIPLLQQLVDSAGLGPSNHHLSTGSVIFLIKKELTIVLALKGHKKVD
jgi:hypothetical protein